MNILVWNIQDQESSFAEFFINSCIVRFHTVSAGIFMAAFYELLSNMLKKIFLDMVQQCSWCLLFGEVHLYLGQ